MSNTKDLKQQSITPFIKLLETAGMLHGEKFVGMGIHDEKLYLVKMHCRPERVVVTNGDFAFLNKKGDGPAFNVENGQSLEQALAEYQFFGDNHVHFTETIHVPETDMQRKLMASGMQRLLSAKENGEAMPSMETIVGQMFGEMMTNPDAVDFLMKEDPSITQEEAEAAVRLGEQLSRGELNADQFLEQAGVAPELLHRAEEAAAAAAPAPEAPAAQAEPEVEKPRVQRGWPLLMPPAGLGERLFHRFGWA